jgi:hypothetical protein
MTTEIEAKIEREIWEVLKQIKQDLILAFENQSFLYEVIEREKNKEYPSVENQRKIIDKLARLCVIKIHRKNYAPPSSPYNNSFLAEIMGTKPWSYEITIPKKEFDEFFFEYRNKFSNSPLPLEQGKPETPVYITKEADIFRYNGSVLPNSNTYSWRVFRALYKLLPNGGDVSYADLSKEIRAQIPEKKKLTEVEMRKFISANLTDRHNGFLNVVKIRENMPNGLPLIVAKRGKGIFFNNKKS